ncbi:MAG TPA: phosphate ABC transporter substrate-binding protein PstS, partial [Candidatus Angelobacter sp.]|nr:phosphate ABC transporter substrate-binding protein PstS [Candidatus Angelobacter sp.]
MVVKGRAVVGFRFAGLVVSVVSLMLMVACTSSKPPKTGEEAAGAPREQIPAGSTVLKGAGSSFASIIIKRWATAYHGVHPDVYVKYASVGSGEGVRRFIGKNLDPDEQVDFGASDSAMSDTQLAEVNNNAVLVPATAGCVVLAYNIPGFTGELKLSRQAYAGIFLGEITSWNDPLIAKSNPGVKLPKLTIATIVRQDSSGTTFAFTRNLDAINDHWRSQFGSVTLANWPGNAMRAKGNEGVSGMIENSAGSIGYVGYEFARRLGLSMAVLENKEGNYIKPSEQSCAAALATVELPDNLRAFVPDPKGAGSYPIATFS